MGPRSRLVVLSLGVLLGATTLWAVPAYRRSDWPHWIRPVEGSCRDTRALVLARDAVEARTHPLEWSDDGCRVIGGLWFDLYTGHHITDPTLLDVDHTVPLHQAHQSGGWAWPRERKEAYANRLTPRFYLVAVHRSANRQKGAQTPETWRPRPEAHCQYGLWWATIKWLEELESTASERTAVRELVESC